MNDPETPEDHPSAAPEPAPLLSEPVPIPGPTASGDDAEKRLEQMTRRGFTMAGAGLAGVLGMRQWLVTRPLEDGIPWPLRRILEFNEKIGTTTFDPSRYAPTFPVSRARMPRANGLIGLPEVPPDAWQLAVTGENPAIRKTFTLTQIQELPQVEQVTEFKCIEGWSTIVHWTGARLSDLAALTGLSRRSGQSYDPATTPDDILPYASLRTPDEKYYVGLDMPSALHPQTLLCYAMNGLPLTAEHGAPLRLVIPVKYGTKHLKCIGTLQFTAQRPADFWALRGYDWFSGH